LPLPEGPGTPAADLFALGKVLYETLTGLDRRQFPNLPAELRQWSDAALVFELNEIILKACAPDARERYPSADSMLVDLKLLDAGKSLKRRQAVKPCNALGPGPGKRPPFAAFFSSPFGWSATQASNPRLRKNGMRVCSNNPGQPIERLGRHFRGEEFSAPVLRPLDFPTRSESLRNHWNGLAAPARKLQSLATAYQKVSGSRAIGPHLDSANKRSHSFGVFVGGIRKLLTA